VSFKGHVCGIGLLKAAGPRSFGLLERLDQAALMPDLFSK